MFGVPRSLARNGLLVSAVGLLTMLAIGGCATSSGPVFEGPQSWAYTASTDSLNLDEFLSLSVGEQEARRDRGYDYHVRAQQARSIEDEIRLLINAGGLMPDDPQIWLRLAHLGRWVGDYVQTEEWLDNAAAAVRELHEDLPQSENSAHWEAARRTGLLRGWVHYDRAEWREGLAWLKTLHQVQPGDANIVRLRGLLAGGAGTRSIALRMADDIERQDPLGSDATWIKAALDQAQGRPSEALNYLLGIRAKPAHAAECYRQVGEVAEQHDELSYAKRYYRESYHHLPFRDKSALASCQFARLGDPRSDDILEFWTAFDRFYVTGSLAAYTAYAWDRYERSDDPRERGFWAGQAVNGAGILIRKNMERAWALRMRGLIFLQTDELEKGLTDLRRASRQLKDMGRVDQRVEAALGHALLLKERHQAALPHLRSAVELGPEAADAWADLGLALVMTKDVVAAEQALNRSLRLDAESATAWFNRGLLHLRGGNFEQAEKDLTEAARLAPGNAEVVKLLQKAHSLQKGSKKRGTQKQDGSRRSEK